MVGELNDGWRLAKVTLGNERISLSTGGVLWGNGPTALELIESITDRGPGDGPAPCGSESPTSTSNTPCSTSSGCVR